MASTPQDRYSTPLTTRKLEDGRVVFLSARPESIKPTPFKDVEVLAAQKTRMDVLANNAYGSAQNWWVIASANGRVDGSLFFRPGSKIIIPGG